MNCTSSEEYLYGSFSGIVTDADTKQPLNSVSSDNVGTENPTGSNGRWEKTDCGYYTRHSTNCPIITMDNKDLVDALNEWVNDNAPTLYRKWIYKKNSEGKVYPAME